MATPDSQPLSATPDPAGDASPLCRLEDLRGLRTAPALDEPQRQALRAALVAALAPCSWFTIGVMAASAAEAVGCLRRWESALGWRPLQAAEAPEAFHAAVNAEAVAGPVFLKGNQSSGSYRLRQEAGLGVGVLVSGHNPDDPSLEDTWGPFPLDLFA